MAFSKLVYFSPRLSLLYKGRFQASQVGVMSIFLRADVVVSEGLTVDYNFFGMHGMIAGFVNLSMVVHRVFVYGDL